MNFNCGNLCRLQVLREIFRLLNTKDLLELSLVNKLWNRECRRVLRDTRKIMAVIKWDNLCLRAREFNDMVGNLAVNPISGLCVTVDQHECEVGLWGSSMEDIYGNLLNMNIKYLQLLWYDEGRSDRCALEKFILRFLATSQTLENLHLMQAPPGILLEQEDWHSDQVRLPNLRTIKLGFKIDLEEDGFENHRANFSAIVARAPNLQEVQNRVCLDFIEGVPLEKMHIIKNLDIMRAYQLLCDVELLFFWDKYQKSQLKLHALALNGIVPFVFFTKEIYLHWLTAIIRSTSESLRTMEPDYFATLALKAIAGRLPPLGNVTKLIVKMFTVSDVRIAHELQQRPLASMFPNVTTVLFTCSESVQSFITEGPQLFPWTTVTKVEVKCWEIGNLPELRINVAELGLVFPKARTLKISPGAKRFDPVQVLQILSCWPSLERLSFQGKMKLSIHSDMDAGFCGISDEEAAFLRQKDEEYLKAVNIVPIKPAFSHYQGTMRFVLLVRAVCYHCVLN